MLRIGLKNSMSLTLIPFLIYFLCVLAGVTFPLVAVDKITAISFFFSSSSFFSHETN